MTSRSKPELEKFIDLVSIAAVLDRVPKLAVRRHSAQRSNQWKVKYELLFADSLPGWVSSEGHDRMSALCEAAVEARARLPALRPTDIELQSAVHALRENERIEKLSQWGGEPSEVKRRILELMHGPYDQLREACNLLEELVDLEDELGVPDDRAPWREVERSLFGETVAELDVGSDGLASFSASRMDGPSVDLIRVSGLPDSDELSDCLWSATNWENLLASCEQADVVEAVTIDEVPGYSDTYFTVSIADPEKFARQLRCAILGFVCAGD